MKNFDKLVSQFSLNIMTKNYIAADIIKTIILLLIASNEWIFHRYYLTVMFAQYCSVLLFPWVNNFLVMNIFPVSTFREVNT